MLGTAPDLTGAYHGVALVEDSHLARSHAVARLVELEPETPRGRHHPSGDGFGAVAQLDGGTLHRHVETPRRIDCRARQRRTRPDDDGVRPRVGAEREERSRRREPEALALARSEAP